MSGRGLNLLSLDFVRDPESLIKVALGKETDTCDILKYAHVGWTVFFKTAERERAAERLLELLPKHGLGWLVDEVLENTRALAADGRPAGVDVPDDGGER